MIKKSLFVCMCLLLLQACTQKKFGHGVVVSAHPEASKAGLEILKKGGNAVDAAVATHFALAVVYPSAGNIGGGGFMVFRDSLGLVQTLDFREKAPLSAHRDMYLDENNEVIDRLSLDGALAVGVPGSVAGMYEAHKKHGKLPWKELLQPAIDLAEKGFKLTKREARKLNQYKEVFDSVNGAPTYLSEKTKWSKGDISVQKDLAKVLTLIRDHKDKGFYEGTVADLIVAQMEKSGGIISHEDLKKYQPVWRVPLKGRYKNYTLYSMPPPSSGGVVLLQILKMVEDKPLKRYGFQTDSMIQLLVEAERRAYADRATHLGDPDFYKVPLAHLLDSIYLSDRMSDFSWNKASLSKDIHAGSFAPAESMETTHFSVVDKDRNAVAVTTTLNGAYGSKLFVQGGGFLLNNEMDDFSIKPGFPNMFGLIGGTANAVEPEKRMLSSMTPTIVEKDGKLFLVLGSPGGSTIITTVLQVFLNVTEFDMGIQKAVSAARFHHQWLPEDIVIEKTKLDKGVMAALKKKGYSFKEVNAIGQANCIMFMENNRLTGGADPRGDNYTAGY